MTTHISLCTPDTGLPYVSTRCDYRYAWGWISDYIAAEWGCWPDDVGLEGDDRVTVDGVVVARLTIPELWDNTGPNRRGRWLTMI